MKLNKIYLFSLSIQRKPEGENNGESGENNGEHNESSDGAGENRRRGGRRGPPRGEGGQNKEQSSRPPRRRGGGRNGGGDGAGGGAGDGSAPAGGRPARRNGEHRICIKLTEVSQESRARDIKQSLRERQCNPSRIVMKGDTCYVHYFKPETDVEAASAQIIDALAGLTIKSESGERPEYPVKVELLKQEKPVEGGPAAPAAARVETTDVTAV